MIFGSLFFFFILYAGGSDGAYGGAALLEEANHLKSFLFGPFMKIAGLAGGAFGILRSFQSQSVQPLLLFGFIGASTIMAPKFIDAVFTALVP